MKNRNIIVVIIVFLSFQAKAQYKDLEAWYTVGVTKKLNSKWNVGLAEEFRFNSNALHLDKHFTDLQFKYKKRNWIYYQLGARYYFDKSKDNYWNGALRINADLYFKAKKEDFSFVSRTRFQTSLNEENTIGRLHSDEALFREKFTLKYNFKKYNLKPFFSAEFFLEDYFVFNTEADAKKPLSVKLESNKIRLKIGTEWKINKQHYLKFFYGYQQELNQVINQRNYILSIGYTYKLPNKKRDEK